ncbi:MAG: aminoacyl-tRNA hydrolase [Lachnospiraceae bacterium]|nr:aminoacyl-tRNA hydrolase [Lachnospiraceae bacterium]
MYIIAGLGNPGKEYDNTRHNIGFDVIDMLADKCNTQICEKKHKALIGKCYIAGQKCVLVKPQTYMNLSGESLLSICEYYHVDPKEGLMVISDDINLDVGMLRIRPKGSAGGHNGLKNIIALLKTDEFVRIRMGVGEKPKGFDLAAYVLGHFNPEERKLLNEAAKDACDAIELIITSDVDQAMNKYNSKRV